MQAIIAIFFHYRRIFKLDLILRVRDTDLLSFKLIK